MKRFLTLIVALFTSAALAQVPIYTRPSANISGTSPTGVTFDASDVFQAEDSLTAFATGGQASATAMSATKSYHRFSTVVTAGDSGKLPAATVGQAHYVRNDGAAAMQVFGASPDTINGVATGTGISQGVGMGVWYICTTAGAWTTSPVSTITATTKFLAADGTSGAPSYSFTSGATTGLYYNSSKGLIFSNNNPNILLSNANIIVASGGGFQWNSGTAVDSGSADLVLVRDAANTLAQKNGTNAQVSRLYFSTTGPIYAQNTARTAGQLTTGVGGAMQQSFSQTTVPTITTNGGTGPSCVGTDTAMVCTIGTSPPAAATFTVTFNGTWPAAPACVAMRNTTGATPLVQGVVPGTGTVVVNLSANLVASEKFAIQCLGVN